MNRRELLGYFAAAAVFPPINRIQISPEIQINREIIHPGAQYGFTRAHVNARRMADINDLLIGQYQPGALLRYTDAAQFPGWIEVKHDSWHHLPKFPLANGAILVPENLIESITPDTIAPINPHIPLDQKVVEVVLSGSQHFKAWEGSQLAREGPCATGISGHTTPPGDYRVFKRQLSRHMQGVDYDRRGNRIPWDLPGVPFVQTFTGSGIAWCLLAKTR